MSSFALTGNGDNFTFTTGVKCDYFDPRKFPTEPKAGEWIEITGTTYGSRQQNPRSRTSPFPPSASAPPAWPA